MFELLVPAEAEQLKKVNGDKSTYDIKIRPALMVETITELQDEGVEPDVWKVEGLDRREDCEKVVQAVRRDGRAASDALCWAAGRASKRCANGSPPLPQLMDLSDLLWAGQTFGTL